MNDALLKAVLELSNKIDLIHLELQKAQGLSVPGAKRAVEITYAYEEERKLNVRLRNEYKDTMSRIEEMSKPLRFLEKHLKYNPETTMVSEMRMKIQFLRSVLQGLGV